MDMDTILRIDIIPADSGKLFIGFRDFYEHTKVS
jgi:hypothetical protein